MKQQQMHLKDYSINKAWTLFLDRDGVVNERLTGDYVKSPEEFRFLPGAAGAIASLSEIFGRIVIVTNQQGIGKGLMTEEDLYLIHGFMMNEIQDAGGKIDAIYFSPHLEQEDHPMRKPGTGMALRAKQDFPEIDFKRSVMVGDGIHDMAFGRKLGMICVYVSGGADASRELYDVQLGSLVEFVELLSC
ncbi:MAG: HAD-IIIA family hydrolase [Bacteroidales bacterium]|nr:HAD-IIIA family hydrolase [Bacteroidales bacterium]